MNGVPRNSPRTQVCLSDTIALKQVRRYVSRAAYKLIAGLDSSGIVVDGKICADFGSSTGGFVQVLLERGAQKVYAIDTAANELDWKIRSDARVVALDRTNVCFLETLPEEIDVISVDISLVPVTETFPSLKRVLKSNGEAIVLVKPQYQLDRSQVPEGGVILDPKLWRAALEIVLERAFQEGLSPWGMIPSPIKGGEGNQEFLVFLSSEPRSPAVIDETLFDG